MLESKNTVYDNDDNLLLNNDLFDMKKILLLNNF